MILSNLIVIAKNTFREAVRDKILYNLVFFALGLILFSILLGDWAVFSRGKVMKDFSIGVMSLSGLLIAVFIGIGLIQKEIQRRTVFTLLAKPIPRWQFITGKYLGLLLVLAVNLLIMTVCFFLVLWLSGQQISPIMLQAIYLIYLEMALVVSFALVFSTFSTPVMSAIFTIGLWVAGHLTTDIMSHLEFSATYGALGMEGADSIPEWLRSMFQIIYYIIPNLESFNIKSQVVYGDGVSFAFLGYSSLYAVFYIALFLTISTWWFGKRDFA